LGLAAFATAYVPGGKFFTINEFPLFAAVGIVVALVEVVLDVPFVLVELPPVELDVERAFPFVPAELPLVVAVELPVPEVVPVEFPLLAVGGFQPTGVYIVFRTQRIGSLVCKSAIA